MKYIILSLSILICSIAARAQQTKLLTAEKHNEYGLVYTLPLTAFKVNIVAVKEQSVAGPFSKYSKIFTSDSRIIDKDAVKWTIESVNVTPYGVPDSENRYLMQLKAGNLTFIEVAEDGMLLSINKEVEPETPADISITELEGTPVSGKEYLEFVNEDFISAISSYKKAQLLAEEIMEIRDAKISLTRGTAETMPTDGRQLEIMLESLEKQERALMNAFTGASWKERVVRTFTVVPEDEGNITVCRLNPSEGLMDPSGKGTPVILNVKLVEDALLPVDNKGDEKKIPKDAVMYCIPGLADITVSLDKNKLFNREFPMSQFGMLFGLNPSIFTDKKEPSYAVFDPSTGALIEVGSMKQ
ncbi:MAG: DUF4831 family protein [Muribaculaceae bacterium]|nr:DUF4831 family protein [Muribaculaceae bacterium]